MIDTSNLIDKLQNLSGADFEEAEKAERNGGNMTPIISFSAGFQARLAAAALNTNIHEIKNLPIPKYNQIITSVANFLFSTLAGDTTE